MPGDDAAVEAFVDGLNCCGADARVLDGHVIYAIEPVEGTFAGIRVETAVDATELARWPLVPPHWIHLPANVTFSATNSRPSAITGWSQHSRQITGWGQDAEPAAGWLSHVRSVVGEAR
jgi:hypothetical protein